MADTASRMELELLKFLDEKSEKKIEQLILNESMPDPLVHKGRGYIAAMKEVAIFITGDLRKKLNEG